MIVFAAILFLAYVLSILLIPSELNQTVSEEELDEYD
jgi:hypothetical protein